MNQNSVNCQIQLICHQKSKTAPWHLSAQEELLANHAQLAAERAHKAGLEAQLQRARVAQAEAEAGMAHSELSWQREAAELRMLLVREHSPENSPEDLVLLQVCLNRVEEGGVEG